MSIRYKILLILLSLGFITHMIVSTTYYITSQESVKNSAVSNLEAISNIQYQRINTFVNNNIEKLNLISSRTQLRRSLKLYNDTKDLDSYKLMKKILKDAMAESKTIDNIHLIDLNGNAFVYSHEKNHTESFKEHKLFLQAKDKLTTSYIIDESKKHSPSVKIVFSAPLILNNELLGVIAMQVNMNYLNDYIRDYTGLGNSGEVIMGAPYDEDKILLFTPLRFNQYSNIIDKDMDCICFKSLDSSSMKEILIEGKDYRGEDVLAVSRYLEELGFGFTVKMDKSEVFMASEELKYFLLRLLFILVIVVIVASIILSRLITKPVIDIVRAAQLISQGDFNVRIEKLSKDELGQLTDALNQMADKLINTNIILEEKVKKRTFELHKANMELQRLSQTDGLTGVANRAKFDIHLVESIRRHSRYKKPLSLFILDIDHFKAVNDTYGHQVGDEYLKKIAKLLKSSANRIDDLPARYGGEEFALILEDTDNDGALLVAENLRQSIFDLQLDNLNSKVSPYVTVSIGVATIIPDNSTGPEYIIKKADDALYEAKKSGRNKVCTSTT